MQYPFNIEKVVWHQKWKESNNEMSKAANKNVQYKCVSCSLMLSLLIRQSWCSGTKGGRKQPSESPRVRTAAVCTINAVSIVSAVSCPVSWSLFTPVSRQLQMPPCTRFFAVLLTTTNKNAQVTTCIITVTKVLIVIDLYSMHLFWKRATGIDFRSCVRKSYVTKLQRRVDRTCWTFWKS